MGALCGEPEPGCGGLSAVMADSFSRPPTPAQPVLIADADANNVRHVENLLRTAGVKNPIRTFEEGPSLQSFLQHITRDEEAKPCVLFLDPRMPGAHGYNPVRWIRQDKNLSDMKVVIFSSTNYPEEIEGAGDLGVHLFLKKHPDLSSLSTIVTHLCGVQANERQPWNSYAPTRGAD